MRVVRQVRETRDEMALLRKGLLGGHRIRSIEAHHQISHSTSAMAKEALRE